MKDREEKYSDTILKLDGKFHAASRNHGEGKKDSSRTTIFIYIYKNK